jgi:hypothetical protein
LPVLIFGGACYFLHRPALSSVLLTALFFFFCPLSNARAFSFSNIAGAHRCFISKLNTLENLRFASRRKFKLAKTSGHSLIFASTRKSQTLHCILVNTQCRTVKQPASSPCPGCSPNGPARLPRQPFEAQPSRGGQLAADSSDGIGCHIHNTRFVRGALLCSDFCCGSSSWTTIRNMPGVDCSQPFD